MIRWIPALMLAGCPWVGTGNYTEVRDVDGDGGIAERFGGRDCVDDDASIADCDADGDGVLSDAVGGLDCDDSNATVHPDAPEICDTIDNDCDGAVDNDDPDASGRTPFFIDADQDGDGDPAAQVACQAYSDPTDSSTGLHVPNSLDCDDLDPQIHTRADELCDTIDNDCDGTIDDVGVWYQDADLDGHGAPGVQVSGPCILPANEPLAATPDDCDDTNPDVNPDAPEIPYDGIDHNCSDDADDWDADLDGHVPDEYWPAAAAQNLQRSLPWSIVRGDCDDGEPEVYVGADEVCDGLDNDCDSAVDANDESIVDSLAVRFLDVDGDGSAGTEVQLCVADVDPAIHAEDGPDCYDALGDPTFLGADPAAVNPSASEQCDSIDNDCDSRTDWAELTFLGASPHFLDTDGDGFGVDGFFACGPTADLVSADGDCDDDDATRYPGAVEICGDQTRQDCLAASIWDCDADGQEGDYFGSGTGEDCDDDNEDVYATDAPRFERCDGIDNDCDGLIDSDDPHNLDETALTVWWPDLDHDGFGDDTSAGLEQCDAPATPASTVGGDCDDADPILHPLTIWYADVDGDGFGDPTHPSPPSCTEPLGAWTLDATDCNDLDASFRPDIFWVPDDDGDFLGAETGAVLSCEPPDGHVRQSAGVDCDDQDTTVGPGSSWYLDHDGDGAGDSATAQQSCLAPTPQHVTLGGDCNDDDPTVDPQRPETCNGVDDDCDGAVDDADDNLIGSGPLAYRDLDEDGFGSSLSKRFCFAIQPGWTDATGDCNDGDPTIHPAAIEICGNGVDDDCIDGENTPSWYIDQDGDGFGGGSASPAACDPPDLLEPWVTVGSDCNDLNGTTFPGAIEADTCDGEDQDCDGVAEPLITWYLDRDLDGLGDDSTAEMACTPPLEPGADAVVLGGDCDDTDPNDTVGRIWYRDADGDGLGNSASSTLACAQIVDGVEQSLWLVVDQNANGTFDPGDEQLSVNDGDCNDGRADVGLASNWFVDADGDGFGSDSTPLVTRCPNADGTTPTGLSISGGDCADVPGDLRVQPPVLHPEDVNPLMGEGLTGFADPTLFDHEDNNCDTLVDLVANGIVWFADVDGDGFGGAFLGPFQAGAVSNNSDCDDLDASVLNGRFLYSDQDGDTFGTGSPIFVGGCGTLPAHHATISGDCDDTTPLVNPNVTEVCDGVDNDCDSLLDENLPMVWEDFDRDGAGTGPATCAALVDSSVEVGAPEEEDCDDRDDRVAPDFAETCDGVDNNCDGHIDEGSIPAWPDADGDGHTLAHGVIYVCNAVAPPGYTLQQGPEDCDDQNDAVFLGQPELCSTPDDDNCDHVTDTGLRFEDRDGDLRGDPALPSIGLCVHDGYALTDSDCDDHDSTVFSGATEVCDTRDNDCDGQIDEDLSPQELQTVYRDFDGDGEGSPLVSMQACAGAPPHGYALTATDCDDEDDQTYTGAPEQCDGVDTNCDEVPEPDQDGDGWFVCGGPDDDCQDDNPLQNPGITIEYCDGVDNDCDGSSVGGDPDVSNPFTGTITAEDGFLYGIESPIVQGAAYADRLLTTCRPVSGTWDWPDDHLAPAQVISITSDTLHLLAACYTHDNWAVQVNGSDEDGDGFGVFTGRIEDLSSNCPESVLAGASISFGQDCAPDDPTRFFTVNTVEYSHTDRDRDGLVGIERTPLGECVGFLYNTGTDCDDHSATSFTHADLVVRDPSELQEALDWCVDGTIRLDLDAGPWPTDAHYASHADTTLEIEGIGDHTCSALDDSTCVSGLFEVDGDLTFSGVPLNAFVLPNGTGHATLRNLVSLRELETNGANEQIDAYNVAFTTDESTALAARNGRIRVYDSTFEGLGTETQIYVEAGRVEVYDSAFTAPTSDRPIAIRSEMFSGEILVDNVSFDGLQSVVLTSSASARLTDVQVTDTTTPFATNPPGLPTLTCERCTVEFLDELDAITVNGGTLRFLDSQLDVVQHGILPLINVATGATLQLDQVTVTNASRTIVHNEGVLSANDLTVVAMGEEPAILTRHAGVSFVRDLDALATVGPNVHLFFVDTMGQLDVEGVRALGGSAAGVVHVAGAGSEAVVSDVVIETTSNTIEPTFAVFEAINGTIVASNIEHHGDPLELQWLVNMQQSSHVTLRDVESHDTLGTRQGEHSTGNGTVVIEDSELHVVTDGTNNHEIFANNAGPAGQTILDEVRVFHTGGTDYITRTNGGQFYFRANRSLFYTDTVLRMYAGSLVELVDSSVRMNFLTSPTDNDAPLVATSGGEIHITGSILDLGDSMENCKVHVPTMFGFITITDSWLRQEEHLDACPNVTSSGLEEGPDIHWDPLTGLPLNAFILNTYGEFRQ